MEVLRRIEVLDFHPKLAQDFAVRTKTGAIGALARSADAGTGRVRARGAACCAARGTARGQHSCGAVRLPGRAVLRPTTARPPSPRVHRSVAHRFRPRGAAAVVRDGRVPDDGAAGAALVAAGGRAACARRRRVPATRHSLPRGPRPSPHPAAQEKVEYMEVDPERDSKLRINFDVTFPDMPCAGACVVGWPRRARARL